MISAPWVPAPPAGATSVRIARAADGSVAATLPFSATSEDVDRVRALGPVALAAVARRLLG